jgi:predicted aspartyl protease
MGTFRTSVTVRHIANRSKAAVVQNVLVDTGSEATWISRRVLEALNIAVEVKDRVYTMANGQQITRSIGYVVLESEPDFQTVDEVVFAEDGDLQLLGARTLEGFNARIEPVNKRLVAAGPIPAAGNIETKPE